MEFLWSIQYLEWNIYINRTQVCMSWKIQKIPAMSISLLALGYINVYFRCISFKIWICFSFLMRGNLIPHNENLQEIMLVIVK